MDSSSIRLRSINRAVAPRRVALSLWIAFAFWIAASTSTSRLHADQSNQEGSRIYQDRCASCHGEEGQGVEGAYAKPLIGDDSPAHLAKYIAKTMPKEDPDKCTADEAIAVADYIHQAFYSEAAQWRKRPPRREAAHLTQHQLRQSLSDLYGSFVNFPGKTEKRGVRAIYFNGDRWKNEEKKLERIDPQIDFDFDRNSPAEGIKPEAFYIYWEGAIEPPVTGRYELVVRSTCSFVMHLGKIGRTLIDNHVQSGDKTEFRQTVELTAGRSYPFKIDFIQNGRCEPIGRLRHLLFKPPFRLMIAATDTIAVLRCTGRGMKRPPQRHWSGPRSPSRNFGRSIGRSRKTNRTRTARSCEAFWWRCWSERSVAHWMRQPKVAWSTP
jgi:mono/diheme cytochrome c family protein